MCDSSVEAAKDHGSWSSQQQDRHSHPSNGVMRGFEIRNSRLHEMGNWGGNGRKEVKAERGEEEREARGRMSNAKMRAS